MLEEVPRAADDVAGRVPDVVPRTPDVVLPVRTDEDDVPRVEDGLATLTTFEFLVLVVPLFRADADERDADVARDAAGREARATPLTELPRDVACLDDAELRTAADAPLVEGLVAYLVDIPLLLSLAPKCIGPPPPGPYPGPSKNGS